MTRPAILFVDDEPHVLSGLRRTMSRRGSAWEFHFAQGGLAALECLAVNRIDILVTDMRMPGMDGAELLDQVRRRYPTVARIILSGHADRDSIIAAAGSTQQFLSKPCDTATLVEVLESTLATRALMANADLRSILGCVDNLPKPPGIFAELTALTNRPEATVKEIAHLVERDVATATELLKLVNSSFFGVANEVTTVSRAVTLLGLDVIQALVLAGRVFQPTRELPRDLAPAELAGRGVRACLSVRRTGAVEGWGEALTGQLSLAALLYDVGLLVLAANDPDAWSKFRQVSKELPEREAQVLSFGCTIGQASAYLLGLWGFHPSVVNALAEQPIGPGDDISRLSASSAGLAVADAHRLADAAATLEGSLT